MQKEEEQDGLGEDQVRDGPIDSSCSEEEKMGSLKGTEKEGMLDRMMKEPLKKSKKRFIKFSECKAV